MQDWTEKYRPKTLDDIVGNEKSIIALRAWAASWNNKKPKQKAVILSGRPGTGKTSSALALANDFGWIPIELNTSDSRNAEKIKKVATSGAIHETFTDSGEFIPVKKGGRKLIILDEADNLYERTKKSEKSQNDLSDKGGKKAIIDTIKVTNQPIVLIVNDYYSLIRGSGEILKNKCKLLKFYDPYPNQIGILLKKICANENITIDIKVLNNIASRCKGDIRSAVNDLQSISLNNKLINSKTLNVLGYRDREKDIFTALREIFKTKNIKSIRESILHLDLDPKLLMLWLNENIPKEYIDRNDLVNAYDKISLADTYLGRTFRRQYYGFWSYACDIMNSGISLAKTHNYPNNTYNFPSWLKERKKVKSKIDIGLIISKKLSSDTHLSLKKTNNVFLPYFKNIFQNDTFFAIKMKNKFDLTENEIEYLLGKKNAHKIKEIFNSSDVDKIKTIETEIGQTNNRSFNDKKENAQPSLFDF